MLRLTVNELVHNEDLTEYSKYVEWKQDVLEFFKADAGREHYKLLSFLVKQLPPQTIVGDIGTCYGLSGVALAVNPNVAVISYDIVDCFEAYSNLSKGKLTMKDCPRVYYRVANCLEPSELAIIKNLPLLFLDVDPHDGLQEINIIQALIKVGYTGIIVCDDIHLNPQMEDWWSVKMPAFFPQLKRVDLTRYGHWSGTGAIVFDSSKYDIVVT
jgi:predicted O-methyltransferase YrrM